MKSNWDEAKGAGTKGPTTDYRPRTTDEGQWLPPFTEWDFRTIKERESRMACCWEYARNAGVICDNLTGWLDGVGGMTTLGTFICTDGARFPEPWIMACDGTRLAGEEIESEESPITVYSLKARKEFVLQGVASAQQEGRDVLEVLQRLLLSDGYVMTLDFETAGSDAVVRALSGWARQEAKKLPRVRRGKGAAPPFEWLKWLAALRLESARTAAGVRFETVQAVLAAHQREFPIADGSPTLPLYASHGAWSKAISDARKALALLESEPLTFEKRILLF